MVNVGGQAIIEGVMMKYENKVAIAVRAPSKEIKVEKVEWKVKESKIPFLRGIINLFTMLILGIKTLNLSARIALEEEKEEGEGKLIISLAISLIFAILLFKFLPLAITTFIDNKVGLNSFLFNGIDGSIRFLILIIYLVSISKIKDIQRVFQYHGAEHKVVNCFEAKKELTVKNVQSFTTVHKRCGTTFVFLVFLISFLVYLFIPKSFSFLEKLMLRIALLPIIASLSYEFLRLGARYDFLKVLINPGLWIQKLTTREPTDDQVEVAIASLKAVLD